MKSNQPIQTITGRLGKSPVLYNRTTKKGMCPVAKFSLAVEVFGGGGSTTVWYQCSAWDKRSDIIMRHCHKGDAVQLHGFASIEKFDGKNGEVEYNHFNVMYVTFLGKAKANQAATVADTAQAPAQGTLPGITNDNPF